jgi:hypothetical protein
MISKPSIILIDGAAPSVIEAIHAIVKENAIGWWHYFGNVWIVGGYTPSEWRDLIRDVIPRGRAVKLLVIELPAEQRNWASFMVPNKESNDWLREQYSGLPPRETTDDE